MSLEDVMLDQRDFEAQAYRSLNEFDNNVMKQQLLDNMNSLRVDVMYQVQEIREKVLSMNWKSGAITGMMFAFGALCSTMQVLIYLKL